MIVLSLLVFVAQLPLTLAFVTRQPVPFPTFRLLSSEQMDVHSDDEWHPRDPAFTTPQLLVGIWQQIAQATSMAKGESMTVVYPQMQEKFTARFLNLLMAHLDNCKDVCDYFGITTSLVPYMDKKGQVVGFTVRSHADPKSEQDDYDFNYDPFWDDGTDFDKLYEGIDDEYEDGPQKDPYPPIVNKVPDDDDLIIDISKKWVNKICSEMGICPFTNGPDKAGLPLGNVYYDVDRSTTMEDMYARYWKEVVRLENSDEREMSTILLIAPEFCLDQIEVFDTFTTTLTQPLAPLEIENLIQLVFFHPQWSFRDGSARSGKQAGAANYARRSPWPMFNILRTNQVRAAQKGIPTGLVYKQNEKTMQSVGVDKLETMLRLRDWSEIADLKVNRREYDALKIAQDFQETGKVRDSDISLVHDSTPAASKVDRNQVEQGNLVNVMMQALEKRLGMNGQEATKLSGPETSATALAADFLLQELDRIANSVPIEASSTADSLASKIEGASSSVITSSDGETDELKRLKAARFEEARKAIFDELREAEDQATRTSKRGDQMNARIFDGTGIPETIEDGLFPEGLNPDNFY
ncbi:hypothetical protein FisN_2Hh528 [Fistulifera solaris]|uniref:DUF1995 domain-containing protein n=1 Tax=Fistulifera solaris TaxID=1519565 RepID=A0A1Z5JGJ3_FISSO|nr:hypothetical protein FisN_2Hh528 [Fistulifera solaris]|eukprot:GAX13046.1 hypothetical protein FisN_2Hh528 [Fistulifera solaris]